MRCDRPFPYENGYLRHPKLLMQGPITITTPTQSDLGQSDPDSNLKPRLNPNERQTMNPWAPEILPQYYGRCSYGQRVMGTSRRCVTSGTKVRMMHVGVSVRVIQSALEEQYSQVIQVLLYLELGKKCCTTG